MKEYCRSKSIVEILIGAQKDEEEGDTRGKNIRRTEMFVFLRESILRIGTFFQVMMMMMRLMMIGTLFQGLDPAYHGVSMQPDYSLDSHDRDLEVKEMNEGESKVDNGKT